MVTPEPKAQKIDPWVAEFVDRDDAPKLAGISIPASTNAARVRIDLSRGPATMALGLLVVEQALHQCEQPSSQIPKLYGAKGSAAWSLVSQFHRGRQSCWATRFKRACRLQDKRLSDNVLLMTNRRDSGEVRSIEFQPGVAVEIQYGRNRCDDPDQLRCLRLRIRRWLTERGYTVNADHAVDDIGRCSALRMFGAMVRDFAKQNVCAPESVHDLLDGHACKDDVAVAHLVQNVGQQLAIKDDHRSAWRLSLQVAKALKDHDPDGCLGAMVTAAESLWRLGRTPEVIEVLRAAVSEPIHKVRPQTLARFKSCVGQVLQESNELKAGLSALAEAERLSVSDRAGDTYLDRMTSGTIAKRHAWTQGLSHPRRASAKLEQLAAQQADEGFDQPYCNTLAALLYLRFHLGQHEVGLEFANEHRAELARASVANRILALGSEMRMWICRNEKERARSRITEALRLYASHQLQPPCLIKSAVGRAFYLDEAYREVTGESRGKVLPQLQVSRRQIEELTSLGQAI
ncbi:MAG: hypothetical protein IT432_00795 [Phycisphaerales bacterium]|nr:hypothetical protein [Phycisphaerales bacterium]